MSQEIVLHDYWRSSASYRVRIALALKGIGYRKVTVDLLQNGQRGADYLALNPQGLVPTLAIDGLVLTQSLAIIEYLDETRPDPALLPKDPAARAKLRAICLAVAADLHPLANLKVLKAVEALGGAQARADWNRATIREGLVAVEAMLGQSAFACGPAPSMADCVIIPQLYNAKRWEVDLSDMPKLLALDAEAARHPAFIAAAPQQG